MSSEKHSAFFEFLKSELPTSDAAQRINWAQKIVRENIPIASLWELLLMEKTIALRFSWLLSDIGIENSEVLFSALPSLFANRSSV